MTWQVFKQVIFFLSPTGNCAGTSWTKWQRRWVWVWSWAQSQSKSVFLHQSVVHAYTSISPIRPHGIFWGMFGRSQMRYPLNSTTHFPLLIRSWRIPSGWDFQQNVFVNWTVVRPKKSMTFFSNPKMHPPTELMKNSSIQMLGFRQFPDRPTQQLLRIQRWKLLRHLLWATKEMTHVVFQNP